LSLLDTICELFGYPDFFERPINTYSTGMRARLGFAVAYHVDPDIILVDEVLGVGDQEFRTKSTQMMLSKISSDKTAILVSHNLNLIQSICNRVIWLEHGMIKEQGKPAKVVKAYLDGK
jgi:lipopolysaccharide transport system ATP-binding protein